MPVRFALRAFAAILAEARLRASRYIDPADRRTMKESLATLSAWKPNFRVTGSLTLNPSGTVSGTLRLVDLKTGKVLVERTLADANMFDASESFGREVVAALCTFPPSLRLTIASDDSLVLGAGATIATVWNGVFDFPLQALQKSSAVYHLTGREIGAWSAAVTADDCSGTLTWSGTADGGECSVTLRRLADGSLTYSVSYAWFRSTLVDGTLSCTGMPPTIPYGTAATAPVVISERATPTLPANGSGPIAPRMFGGPPMNATWTLAAP